MLAVAIGQAEFLLYDDPEDAAGRQESLESIRDAALRSRDALQRMRRAVKAWDGGARPPDIQDLLVGVVTALPSTGAPDVRLTTRAGHLSLQAPAVCAEAVEALVHQLGGTVTVKAGRATITAPLPGARPAASPRGAARSVVPRRVLVVDDEPGVRDIVGALLRKAGHDVEVAADGIDGIARYRAQRFDCVLTDMDMPGISGLTVSRAIKDHDADAYVVLLSGIDCSGASEELKAAGIDQVLLKPLTRQELLDVIAQVGGS